jgi:hypothetical protein
MLRSPREFEVLQPAVSRVGVDYFIEQPAHQCYLGT